MSEAKEYWAFRFCMEAEDGSPVDRSKAEELLGVILDWVESQGLQIGGGYRAPVKEDETALLYGEEGYSEL